MTARTYPNREDQESHWARLVAPVAGKEQGVFVRPEKDDEVLVGFEHDDLLSAVGAQPFVVSAAPLANRFAERVSRQRM